MSELRQRPMLVTAGHSWLRLALESMVRGQYTRGSLLLQHAPSTRSRSKAPSSAPTISSEKTCCATKRLLPSYPFAPELSFCSRGKSVARVCFRSKLLCVYCNLLAVTWRVSSWPIKLAYFFSSHAPIGLFHHSAPSSCPSCALVGVLTWQRVSGACFRGKIPRV